MIPALRLALIPVLLWLACARADAADRAQKPPKAKPSRRAPFKWNGYFLRRWRS